MSEILQGLDSVLCQIHDILIFGSNQHQHDTRLMAALDRIENSMNDDVNSNNEGNNDSERVGDEENYQQLIQPERSSPIATRTRSRTGIVIRPPDRL